MLTLHRDQDHSEHDSIAQHRMPCLLLLCQAIMLLAGACSPVIFHYAVCRSVQPCERGCLHVVDAFEPCMRNPCETVTQIFVDACRFGLDHFQRVVVWGGHLGRSSASSNGAQSGLGARRARAVAVVGPAPNAACHRVAGNVLVDGLARRRFSRRHDGRMVPGICVPRTAQEASGSVQPRKGTARYTHPAEDCKKAAA